MSALQNTNHYFDPSDGSIHLTQELLTTLRFEHLDSGIYRHQSKDRYNGILQGEWRPMVHGYTEWVTEGDPTASLSWDWCVDLDNSELTFQRYSAPYTNLRIFTNGEEDFGQNYLCKLIDQLEWADRVCSHITIQQTPLLSTLTATKANQIHRK